MNVLVVDDHPMTVEGYINALLVSPFGLNLPIFSKAHNFEEAYCSLMKSYAAKE